VKSQSDSALKKISIRKTHNSFLDQNEAATA